MGIDFLIGARGCTGECAYCSIAAYTAEQRKRYRLRSPEAIADEIASSRRTRDTRVFMVQDDLFVLPAERRAVARIDRLRECLWQRGVRDVVFWAKGRPEHVTPPVCAAARELGVIRLFIGVESASAGRLRYLGRTHGPAHSEAAIASCRESGIVPSFNFMLFDPDCTLDDVAASIDMAARHVDLPWNACRTEVYGGTRLRERLAAEGRLEGDWRTWGYRMRDDRAETMFRVLRVSLHERMFRDDSLHNRLIDLSFAVQVHEHCFPSPQTDTVARAAVDLAADVRRDTVQRLRATLEFSSRATTATGAAEARRFAIDQALACGSVDAAWRAQVQALFDHLTARGSLLMAGPSRLTEPSSR